MIGRLLPVLIGLVAIGIFFAYVHPTYTKDVAAKRVQLASYESALTAAREFKEKESVLGDKQRAIPEEAKARIEAFLPSGVDNVQLILDLDALGSRSGMRLSDFAVDAPVERSADAPPTGRIALAQDSALDSLEVSVSGIGTYSAFRTFLRGVEYSLRPLDLVSLEVSDSETGVYTYDMTFRIYWMR